MAAPRFLMIDELSLGLAPRIVEELDSALSTINAKYGRVVLAQPGSYAWQVFGKAAAV
jgi:ABC-type branched-subunit amino acid transport system ATPase component